MSHQLAPFMKRFFSHYLPVQKGLSVNTLSSYREGAPSVYCASVPHYVSPELLPTSFREL